MEIHRPSRRARIPATFAVLCCCFLPALATRDTEVAVRDTPGERDEMNEALDILLRADPASKREAVEDAGDTFRFLAGLDCDDADSRGALQALERIVRTEKDDWISSRLLQNLLSVKTDCLSPLYRLALKSRSENLRWRGLQWFREHEDKEAVFLLEDLWRFEERPWARADLMGALAENGSARYLDEFLEIAGRKGPTLSRAAFEAIQTLDDPGSVPGLVRLSREGEGAVRKEAISALASWPESPEALLAVLDATRADDPGLKERAASTLGGFPDPRAAERALDLARPGNSEGARSAALLALEQLAPPEALPVLSDLLHEPAEAEITGLKNQAIWILQEMDDPAAIPMIRDLDPSLGGSGFDNLGGLMKSLSRDRSPEAPKSVWIQTSCGVARSLDDPDNPDFVFVAPPSGWLSIRCWEFPGVAGDPEDFERIPGESTAWIQDHFEGKDGPWVEIDSAEATEACWVPRRFLEVPAEGEASTTIRALPGLREFDLPETALRVDPARGLLATGLLRVLDPAEEVTGVVLSLDEGDEAAITRLIGSCRPDDSILQEQIEDLLDSLDRTCPAVGGGEPSPGDDDSSTTEADASDPGSGDSESDSDASSAPEP